MPLRYSRFIPLISITGDFILLNILFVVGFYMMEVRPDHFAPYYLGFYLYLNLSWFILVFVFGAHQIDRNTRKKSIFFSYIKIIVFFFFLFLMYFQAVPLEYYPRSYIKYLFPLFFALLITWKFLLYYAFLLYRKLGFNFRNVIIVGDTPKTRELQHYFTSNRWHGYRFLGFFAENASYKKRIIGTWSDLKEYMEHNLVDEIYIAWEGVPHERMVELTDIISEYPAKVRIVPDLGNFSYKSAELISYGTIPVLQIHPGPLSFWYNRLIKRAFDIVVSLIVIISILSWMTPLLYILSLLGSRDGVFFKQRRTCSDGGEFLCYKYRTMRKNSDADIRKAEKNDSRVTPVGKFLRKFSLDELPQFVNVLKGEMSVVGPRPHMLKHTHQYKKLIKRFMLRHTVKPGITGLAQVNGYRGEIRKLSELKHRVEYDVQYIESWSFNLDFKIILLTTWVIFRGQDKAY